MKFDHNMDSVSLFSQPHMLHEQTVLIYIVFL